MNYRSEIDGLRALAVVPVILFHAGFPMFGGGFVGVDIFFVISGFLITSIILSERDAVTYTLAGFYERRARRILPALSLVMICAIPFAWMWMPPTQLREFAASLVAVSLFSSNFLFWSESGYFAAAASEKPLLHTWSLALEEQFYVLFPILLQIFWFLGRGKLAIGIVAVALASFALSVWGFPSDPDANFYLMPSRAWELLAGSFLAFAEDRKPLRNRTGAVAAQILSGAGLLAVTISIFLFDRATPFPGIAAVLPAGGAWLLLAFATRDTIVGRILSQRWLVGVGLISYSAYLWHQPLFAFARLRSPNEPGPLTYAALSLIAIGLAYFSWRYVELPFRQRRRFSRRQIFTGAASAAAAVIAIGLVGSLTQIGRARFTAAELAMIEPAATTEDDCVWHATDAQFPKIETCRFGAVGGEGAVVLVGDSHAGTFLGALGAILEQRGIPGIMVHNGHCRAIAGIYNEGRTSPRIVDLCERAQSAMLEHIRQAKPRALLLVNRWTFGLFPVAGAIEQLSFDNGEGGREEETDRQNVARDATGRFVAGAEAKAIAVRKLVTDFAELGAPVIVLYPIPEVGWNVANLNFKHLVSTGKFPEVISTDALRFAARNSFVTHLLDEIVDRPGIVAVKPGAILCNNQLPGRCVAQYGGVPLYFDDDHLSTAGARLVAAEIMRHVK